VCDWEGCEKPAEHRAPKGRKAEGEFHHFCLEHVREYNRGFNYFAEMSDEDVAEEMRRANTAGGRPTWEQSTNGGNSDRRAGAGAANPNTARARARTYGTSQGSAHDPLNLFARAARSRGQQPMTERERKLAVLDKRAFETLGFTGRVPAEDIKRAYKDLVKKHHPDANGGDRASEDRLRAIITAYNHLKAKGFVAR